MRKALVALLLSSVAAAAPAQKTTVLVVEYRAGAKGATNFGDRLARIFANNSSYAVIDPTESRRRTAKIDGEVARCGGEARCLGALGDQLGASEVLLLGISQMGDLILTLQRIDSKKGEVGSRIAETLSAGSDPSDVDLIGWLKRLYPPETFIRYGSIQVRSDIDGAKVTVNGKAEGQTPLAPLKLRAPATYQLVLEKSGYTPFRARIDLLPDANLEVRASLSQKAQPIPPYKRWYVWAAVGAVAVAAVTGVAVYYGTRVDDTPTGFILAPKH